MKKIFALVLAAAMLSTTAFADSVHIGAGGTSVANPGADLAVKFGDFMTGTTPMVDVGYAFSADYLTISAKKFSKGSNLVKEVKFSDDANELLIVLNEDYNLARPNSKTQAPNLVIEKLELKVRKDYTPAGGTTKALTKGVTYAYTGGETELFVGYDKKTAELDTSPEFENVTMIEFKNTANTTPYANASITELDVTLDGRVYAGDKVYVNIDAKVNKEVLKISEDADVRFYNIKTNGFPSTTSIQLAVEEDEFVYKIVDNKLVASGLKWSADDYAWTGKIRAGVSYVVSDIALKAAPAVDAPTTGNPETGANDVVGIAAALALVSLVAAGAVSMKK